MKIQTQIMIVLFAIKKNYSWKVLTEITLKNQ